MLTINFRLYLLGLSAKAPVASLFGKWSDKYTYLWG